jgi:hypothetical protein
VSTTEHEAAQVERANAYKSTQAITIDGRWQEVAKTDLDFIRKHT